ncbi:hypothetical protein AVEN_78143-1 [Araneus ventricosus]|uniref:Uncharacterized protein n=1 Tax=Araneus ventricosus TaxID=182803 RepID=A0A4Y2VJB4_ARAVE|nr:hypothetical protein AVEN_78143-1 [Araneus ventricosus]
MVTTLRVIELPNKQFSWMQWVGKVSGDHVDLRERRERHQEDRKIQRLQGGAHYAQFIGKVDFKVVPHNPGGNVIGKFDSTIGFKVRRLGGEQNIPGDDRHGENGDKIQE